MKRRRYCSILVLCLLIAPCSFAEEHSSIYQGTQVKLDIASPILVPASTGWVRQHAEIGVNVRLKDRFYPTFEAGYATPGGFIRLGADINPLKKHPESPHALLVGLRVGSAFQAHGYTDCWGEIVAGCQVEVAKVQQTAFYMGWMGRFKFLFTRNTVSPNGTLYPTYIPGFGTRGNTGWGLNYYLGWRF